jgi:hypothetical protein
MSSEQQPSRGWFRAQGLGLNAWGLGLGFRLRAKCLGFRFSPREVSMPASQGLRCVSAHE